MPNRSSYAGHVPQRTCVICRKKAEKERLLRLVVLDGEYFIDMSGTLQRRGLYVCDDNMCLERLDKWHQKRVRKSVRKKLRSIR